LSLFNELKRRNVFRVALAYLAGAWLLLQIADVIFHNLGAPDWLLPTLLWVLIIGFLPALIFAWVFEFTPGGVTRESDLASDSGVERRDTRVFDRVVIVVLALAVSYFAIDKFVLAPRTGPAAITGTSIAVLPFVNMSEDPDNEYFADGISEELLNLLAKIPELRVISRSSAFTFKDSDIGIPEIAEQLDVEHVLEGSVRKAGNEVRITAQLIEAGSDTHIWSETYDRTLDDVFAIQDEIAEEVVRQLHVTLLGDVATTNRVDPEAYSLFLKARYIMNQYDPTRVAEAEKLLNEALELDPDYGAAMAELARVFGRRGFMEKDESLSTRSRQLIARAMELSPDNGVVHGYYGAALAYEGDIAGAARHFARAVELAPADTFVLSQAAVYARRFGQFEASNEIGEFLVSRDPLCVNCKFRLALGYRAERRLDEADALLDEVRLLEPNHHDLQFLLGVDQLLRGDPAAALVEFEKEKNDQYRSEGRALAFYSLGRLDEFEQEMALLTESGADLFSLTSVYAWTGDTDAAFAALDEMLERDGDLPGIILYEPLLWGLHDDPRWEELLVKIGKSPEDLAEVEFEWNLPGKGD
jgi:TolB-like protein/thioredoxin-like negative regulator of GroEL